MIRFMLIALLVLCNAFFALAQPDNALASIKAYSVTISVADIKQMTDWYEKKLGFEVVETKVLSNSRLTIVTLLKNRFQIELIKDGNANFGFQNRETPPKHTSSWGPTHLTFYTDDLRGIEDELTELNVKIEHKYLNEELRTKYLFIRDPEGNLIRFLQPLN